MLNGNPTAEKEFPTSEKEFLTAEKELEPVVPEIPTLFIEPQPSVANHSKTSKEDALPESLSQPASSCPNAEKPKEVIKEPKKPLFESSLDDAPRVSVTESSTAQAAVGKLPPQPFGFQSMSREEPAGNEVCMFFLNFQMILVNFSRP